MTLKQVSYELVKNFTNSACGMIEAFNTKREGLLACEAVQMACS